MTGLSQIDYLFPILCCMISTVSIGFLFIHLSIYLSFGREGELTKVSKIISEIETIVVVVVDRFSQSRARFCVCSIFQ